MEFRFDIRGYLQPAERFVTTLEDLERYLEIKFGQTSW